MFRIGQCLRHVRRGGVLPFATSSAYAFLFRDFLLHLPAQNFFLSLRIDWRSVWIRCVTLLLYPGFLDFEPCWRELQLWQRELQPRASGIGLSDFRVFTRLAAAACARSASFSGEPERLRAPAPRSLHPRSGPPRNPQ